MQTVDDILEQVRQLPPKDRRQLMERLEETLVEEEAVPEKVAPAGSYAPLLGMAGTVRSDYADVASDKYKHLAAAYADEHDDG